MQFKDEVHGILGDAIADYSEYPDELAVSINVVECTLQQLNALVTLFGADDLQIEDMEIWATGVKFNAI